MKLGFAGRWSPDDRKAWSGTYYNTWRQISKHFDVQPFYFDWPFYVREYLLLHKQYQKLLGKKAAVEFLRDYSKYFSRQLDKALLQHKPDIIFCPGATQLIAYSQTQVPVVYMTDATFKQLQGYYDTFADIAPYNVKQGIELDKRTFHKAAHCVLASDWAQQSAVYDYGLKANKISVVQFGANIERVPSGNYQKNMGDICRLLFLGVEWKRKGGQIALDTYHEIRKQGVPVSLTIVGCTPPGYTGATNDSNLQVIPFLDKHSETDQRRLEELLNDSHFLILPSRAECAGIVFCEAAAYGIPAVTTDTGGIPSYVIHGQTGYTLPTEAPAELYASRITHAWINPDIYQRLSANSRSRYLDVLNWDVWGNRFRNIADQILNKSH